LVTGGEEHFWFMNTIGAASTTADIPDYSFPSSFRKFMQVKVDDYEYAEIDYNEVYEKYELPASPVPILPAYLARSFYIWQDKFWLIPTPSSTPTTNTLTSLTSSGVTCTATFASHGYEKGQYVTIAGADQTAYNGTFRIDTAATNTFVYRAASAPSATPATGTVTAKLANIVYRYWYYATEPTGTTSSIVLPDQFINILVAYAEGRYWSASHKRGKAADAFAEFETLTERLKRENHRRKFYSGDIA
jgi:hypothetical protein